MLKARFLLGALMIALVAGAFQIFEHPTMVDADKNAFYVLDGLLFLSAGILMTINLFSLDEKGHIPYGSMPYRFLHYWNNGKVPKQLKLCPMFWGIFALLFVVTSTVCAVALFGYMFLYLLVDGIKFFILNPYSVLSGLGWASVSTTVLVGVWVTLRETLKIFGVKEAGTASWLILILSGLLFLFGSAIAKSNITLIAGLIMGVKVILILSLGLGLLFVTILAVGYLISWLFPALKNSFLSQLIMAGLGKLCPVIEVETEPKSEYQGSDLDPILFV
jgi:hypothetical protein